MKMKPSVLTRPKIWRVGWKNSGPKRILGCNWMARTSILFEENQTEVSLAEYNQMTTWQKKYPVYWNKSYQ